MPLCYLFILKFVIFNLTFNTFLVGYNFLIIHPFILELGKNISKFCSLLISSSRIKENQLYFNQNLKNGIKRYSIEIYELS